MPSLRTAARYILASALLAFVCGCILRLAIAWNDVRKPFEIDYAEGIVIWQALRVFDFAAMFHPINEYPHVVFHYTPVYHLVLRAAMPLIGDPLFAGRLISLLSTLWTAAVIALLVYRVSAGYVSRAARIWAAIFTVAVLLQTPAVIAWMAHARVDMLALALQYTALVCVVLYPSSRLSLAVAALLLLAGVYTKQNMLPIAASAILVVAMGSVKRAAAMTIGLAVAGFAILAACMSLTGGGVWDHWFRYNVNPFSIKDAFRRLLEATAGLDTIAAMALTAAVLTVPGKVFRNRLRRAQAAFAMVLVFGGLMSFGIGKEGANINYCLDWQIALAPLAAFFLLHAWRAIQQRQAPAVGLFAAVAALCVALSWTLSAAGAAVGPSGITAAGQQRTRQIAREQGKMVELIRSLPGDVVSWNMDLLIRAGKPVVLEPIIAKVTAASGMFNEQSLLDKVAQHYFGGFILHPSMSPDFFSPKLLAAIHRHYKQIDSPYPGLTVYVPDDVKSKPTTESEPLPK